VLDPQFLQPVRAGQDYPINCFYPSMELAMREVIAAIQAPDAMVAMEFFSNMSIAAQGIYDVRLPTGKLCPLSLALLTIADPGERKTAVHRCVGAPVFSLEEAQAEKYKAKLSQYEVELAGWKSMQSILKRKLSKLVQDEKPTDGMLQQMAAHQQSKPVKPKRRRMIHQGTTLRATIEALEGDGESIGFVSDEGDVIARGGVFSELGVLNSAWDGSMLSLDRSKGVSIVAQNPRLTLSCMMQPEVFNRLLGRRGAMMRGSGHWARYLVAWPVSTQGSRFIKSLQNQWTHLPVFHERLSDLLNEYGTRIESGKMTRTVLELSEDATMTWIELVNETESLIGPWGELQDIKDFASKVVEIMVRVAGLLHVFAKKGEEVLEDKISAATLKRAVSIVSWHVSEFQRIFSIEFQMPQAVADAQTLENYLHERYWCKNVSWVKKNVVLNKGPVRPVERLDAALAMLISNAKVAERLKAKRTTYIELNPAYFSTLPWPIMPSTLGYGTLTN